MRSLRFESIADRVRTGSGSDRPGYAVVPTACACVRAEAKQSGTTAYPGRSPTARGSDTETRIVFHNIGGSLLQSRSERMINLCYLPLTHRSLLT